MDHPVARKKIYLVGMMGSGKSFWAGKLGHYFSLPAYDLDKLIEQEAGKTIREIFEQEGENAFRKMEGSLLRKEMPSKKFVMATGGGAPCFFGNMDFMKNTGLVIWLNPPIDELVNRVSRSVDTRPVLGGLKSKDALKAHLLSLIEKRRSWYQQAHVIIEDDSSIEKVVEKIKAYEKTIP
jgi:shikimate kinase